MPSPFPGVDPYLEGSIWSTVHQQLSSEIARQLAPKLAPKYVTLADEWIAGNADENARQVTIEVRGVDHQHLVTTIEVLTPSNKHGPGRTAYLIKRARRLISDAHLIEVDLLRCGQRAPTQQSLPDQPYLILLSRSEKRPVVEVWPIGLRDKLPTIPVPLLPGDSDVPLDLQAAFDAVYDACRFDLALDYSTPPRTPLSPDDARWASEILQKLRGS